MSLAILASCGKDGKKSGGEDSATTPDATCDDLTDADEDGAPACIDCDDGDPAVNPLGAELCNGVDDTCAGAPDIDADGQGVCSAQWTASEAVDLLMVIDDSCSMSPMQQTLSTSIPALVDAFDAASADYRVGVITTDTIHSENDGRLIATGAGDRWIEPGLTDPAGLLADLVLRGEGGSGVEKARDMVHQALEVRAAPGGENAGFLRDDAHLDVLVLSNEDDQSVSISVDDFSTWLAGLKTGDREIRFHSLVSLGSACPTEVGTDYLALTDVFGGVRASICDPDYDTAMTEIAGAHGPAGETAFQLTEAADPATLGADVTDSAGALTHYGATELAWDAGTWTVTLPAPVPAGGSLTLWYAPVP